jgi:hypothetical protein
MNGLISKVRMLSWFVFGVVMVMMAGGCGTSLYSQLATTAGTTVVGTLSTAFANLIANRIFGGQ